MANYANLLATIAANIYTNGKQKVTAAMVKTAMNAAVTSLGAGYQFMGVAHPADTPSGYADLRAFWLAGEAGTYTNFGGLTLADGEVAVIKYDGNGWSKEVTGAATAAQVAELDQKVDDLDGLLDVSVSYPILQEGASLEKYIRFTVGDALDSQSNRATDYVDVSAYQGQTIEYMQNVYTVASGVVGMAWYDASKQYISGLPCHYGGQAEGTEVTTATVPNNAYYARFSIFTKAASTFYVKVATPQVASGQLDDIEGDISQILSDVDDVQRLLGTETKTLIEPTITTGQYINQNGQLVSWSGGRITAPIAVQKGTIIRCEGKANSAIAIVSKTDAQGTSYQVAVAGEGSTSTTQAYNFDYTVDEDGYIIVCSLNSSPVLNILTYSGALQEIKELQEDVEGITGPEVGNILAAFNNLVCVGDSLTYSQVYIGSGTYDKRQAKRTYPEVLAALCGNEYQLLGAPGDSAKHCWDTQKSNIVSKENPLAIIYLGTNNGLTDSLATDVVGDDPDKWADNNTGCYCRFVQKFQSLGYKVLLLNIWATSGTDTADLENSKAAIQHIAERFSCAVMDVPENGAMMFHYYPDLSGYNRVHYNDLGYAWFASALIKAVGSMSAEQIKLLIPNAS